MGYSSTQIGYKCFNPNTNKVIVSRDVKFEENAPYINKLLDRSSEGEHWFDFFPLPIPIKHRENFTPTRSV